MAIEIVDLPMKTGGSFQSYVNVYQAGKVKNDDFFLAINWGIQPDDSAI